ncbi:unnamed protein product, partial [Prorocentrum cordatum]
MASTHLVVSLVLTLSWPVRWLRHGSYFGAWAQAAASPATDAAAPASLLSTGLRLRVLLRSFSAAVRLPDWSMFCICALAAAALALVVRLEKFWVSQPLQFHDVAPSPCCGADDDLPFLSPLAMAVRGGAQPQQRASPGSLPPLALGGASGGSGIGGAGAAPPVAARALAPQINMVNASNTSKAPSLRRQAHEPAAPLRLPLGRRRQQLGLEALPEMQGTEDAEEELLEESPCRTPVLESPDPDVADDSSRQVSSSSGGGSSLADSLSTSASPRRVTGGDSAEREASRAAVKQEMQDIASQQTRSLAAAADCHQIHSAPPGGSSHEAPSARVFAQVINLPGTGSETEEGAEGHHDCAPAVAEPPRAREGAGQPDGARWAAFVAAAAESRHPGAPSDVDQQATDAESSLAAFVAAAADAGAPGALSNASSEGVEADSGGKAPEEAVAARSSLGPSPSMDSRGTCEESAEALQAPPADAAPLCGGGARQPPRGTVIGLLGPRPPARSSGRSVGRSGSDLRCRQYCKAAEDPPAMAK